MIIFWTIIGLVFALLTYVVYYLRSQLLYWVRRGIPHNKPHPIYGSVKAFVQRKENIETVLSKIYYKYKDGGPFAGMHFFFGPTVLLTDLDLIKSVLVRDFSKFSDRGMYYNEKSDPLTGHLFSLDGSKWRHMRQKLSPTFTSGRMRFMLPTVSQVGVEFVRVFGEMVKEQSTVEINDLCARYTTDVIGTCAFGIDCNSLRDPDAEFRRHGKVITKAHRHSQLIEGLIMTFPRLSRRLGMRIVRQDIHEFFMRVVRETVEYREQHKVRRNDFMDLLLEMKRQDELNGLTVEEIAAQTFVFFLAGFETSSATMSFALYELAVNPEIQETLRQEVDTIMEQHNEQFDYDCMKQMPYMDMVIKETLRKYPVVSMLMRKSLEDYRTMNQNFVIPKNLMILIPVDAIHNDPEYYPNPTVFDPLRFTPEQMQQRHSSAYIPFGDGPRSCIGMRFGLMQTFVGLTLLLRNFRFSVCSETVQPIKLDKNSGIMAPEGGIHLHVERI